MRPPLLQVIIAVPSYSSLTIVLTIVGSSIFYGDFDVISVADSIKFGSGVSIVGIGIILLSILQWCRQMRKQRSVGLKPSEDDSLLPREKGHGRPYAASSLTDRTPSEEGGSSYVGDGASTYGDGASSAGESSVPYYKSKRGW